MKNATRIGSSILGTWTVQTELVSGNDKLAAYFIVHFMADPRRGRGCALNDCREVGNHMCMIIQDEDGHAQKACHDIAKEDDVLWSDVSAFFYFGVKVNSESNPKAHFEMETGDWVGPFNLLWAQHTIDPTIDNHGKDPKKLIDRYIARYVQSHSMNPPFSQNIAPPECTLYNLEDDYVAFLGNSALNHMTSTQTKYSIPAKDNVTADPYAPYLQTCDNGNVKPILPQLELDFFQYSTKNDTNSTDNDESQKIQLEMKLQYKIMAVPTSSELAYRVLPHLQSRFQGHGGYNILGGPYCYGDDPARGYSIDLNLDTTRPKNKMIDGKDGASFVRGCVDGFPCAPPAALGGLPVISGNSSCDSGDGHHHHHPHAGGFLDLSTALAFGCYGLVIALLISLTFIWHQSHQHKQTTKRYRQRELDEAALFLPVEDTVPRTDMPPEEVDEDAPALFGRMNLMKGGGAIMALASGRQGDEVGPFGDLDRSNHEEDPLREPLLEQREGMVNEAASSVASREDA